MGLACLSSPSAKTNGTFWLCQFWKHSPSQRRTLQVQHMDDVFLIFNPSIFDTMVMPSINELFLRRVLFCSNRLNGLHGMQLPSLIQHDRNNPHADPEQMPLQLENKGRQSDSTYDSLQLVLFRYSTLKHTLEQAHHKEEVVSQGPPKLATAPSWSAGGTKLSPHLLPIPIRFQMPIFWHMFFGGIKLLIVPHRKIDHQVATHGYLFLCLSSQW